MNAIPEGLCGAACSAVEPLLRVEGLTKSYDGVKKALDGVSFSVGRGQIVAVIGRSGAGKSTLLRCINRLVEPTQGSVVFDGREVSHLRGRELRQTRRRISMVFQQSNLVDRATAVENVLQGRLGYKNSLVGALGLFSNEEKQRAFDLLNRVGLGDYWYARVDQLSGGQRQRVGVARALVQDPLLILADEPIASLDPASSRAVMELLRWAVDELGVACVVSLHQVEYALEFSDYLVCLARGRVCCCGRPDEFDKVKLARVYDEGAETPVDAKGISRT